MATIALPLAILPAFWIMKLLGYTLNSISVLAMTLVIGILVDDAIGLVVAITTSIVAVFLPVSFIDGMTG